MPFSLVEKGRAKMLAAAREKMLAAAREKMLAARAKILTVRAKMLANKKWKNNPYKYEKSYFSKVL